MEAIKFEDILEKTKYNSFMDIFEEILSKEGRIFSTPRSPNLAQVS